ncbi:MAG: SsrA-binding protein SmpB [Patescibacteria group bacterium]
MSLIAKNKFAYFDYHIQEEYEAGIILTGPEVKAIKSGQINLKGSYVTLRGSTPWLINAHVSPYKNAVGAQKKYEPTRDRALLLKKNEIKGLIGKLKSQGLTLIPLSVYTVRRFIKIRLGLGKGKKKYDKRAAIKKRETDRKIQRAIRQKM